MPSVITVHAIDPALAKRISAKAKREGKSLNQTVKEALAVYFGTGSYGTAPRSQRNDIMSLCGILSRQDADDLRKAQSEFRKVHPEDWK